jgi:hypothetical protein
LGVVQIGSGLAVDGNGVVSWDAQLASTTELGVAMFPDEGPLQVDINGNASFILSEMPYAQPGSIGLMRPGTGLQVDGNGEVSLIESELRSGSTTERGIVQIGNGLDVDGNGVVSFDVTQLPVASNSQRGVVQIGSGLTVDGNGVINVDESQLTQASLGVPGVVQVGDGLAVTNGIISIDQSQIPIASTTQRGLVRLAGSGLTIDSTGLLSLDDNVVLTDQVNTFTKAQFSQPVTLTSGPNIPVDGSASNLFKVTLNQNATLDNLTNVGDGRYTFLVTQDGTGSRTLSFDNRYRFHNGLNSIDSTAGSTSVIKCVAFDTVLYCTIEY